MNRHWRNAMFGLLFVTFCVALAIWGRSYFPAQISFPEYIIVRVKDQPAARVAVLINGQRNGTTGQVVTLGSPSRVFISVDYPKAKQKSVNVENTTPSQSLGY